MDGSHPFPRPAPDSIRGEPPLEGRGRGVVSSSPDTAPQPYPAFWRFGDRLFFNATGGLEECVTITVRQAERINWLLWSAACRARRQPLHAELCRWWSELTAALEELANINSERRA